MEKATREQTKLHNIQLVLKTVYQQGDTSRADLARLTNLTRTTVSDIVADLLQDGLLVETGIGESAGGKPPIRLQLQENGRQLICLDLSTTPFQGALVNLRGEIIHRAQSDPEQQVDCAGQARFAGQTRLCGPEALESVYHLLDDLKEKAQAPLLGIGVGVPGLTSIVDGMVRRSVRLDWTDLALGKLLEERYHLGVYLSNDSHAAAQAEFTFGEFRGAPNLILVRISEGIGAGILLSGQLHYGDGYGAGEIGHLTVVDGGRQCSCGNFGCLETVSAPSAIVQRVRELAAYDWLPFSGKRGQEIDWAFISQAFQAGDETVTELIQEAGRYLGTAIANLVSILNVRRIIISGCTVEFGAVFLDAVAVECRRRALATPASETQIVNSTLGPDIIILGLSALVLSKEMGLP